MKTGIAWFGGGDTGSSDKDIAGPEKQGGRKAMLPVWRLCLQAARDIRQRCKISIIFPENQVVAAFDLPFNCVGGRACCTRGADKLGDLAAFALRI